MIHLGLVVQRETETWLYLYCLGFLSEDGTDVDADWYCKKDNPINPSLQRGMAKKK